MTKGLKRQIFKTNLQIVTETSQRVPGELTKHFKSELSPGGQLLPPVTDQVKLLGVGQQHLLCSSPQVYCVVRVSQDEPVW